MTGREPARPRSRSAVARGLARAVPLACAAAVALAAAPAAEARLIDLRAGLLAGGMVGWGSDSKTPDFFSKTRGPALGFDVGARLLVFDVSARFLQVFDGGGTAGTLTQLLLGVAIDVPLDTPGSRHRKNRHFLTPAFVGGFGFGTPGPVSPPLNDRQISDKGVVASARVGYEYFLHPLIAVGGQAELGYHYFLGGEVVTNSQDHSSGVQMSGLGTVTFHLGY